MSTSNGMLRGLAVASVFAGVLAALPARAELLADLFNGAPQSVGVAGTSHAETTVTNNGNYVTVPTNTKLPTEPGTPHFRKPNRHHAQGQYR